MPSKPITLTDAVAELIQAWGQARSDDPISEIWDELLTVEKAWKLATTPAGVDPRKLTGGSHAE